MQSSKFNQEEVQNLNRLVTGKKIKTVMKISPKIKVLIHGVNDFDQNFKEHLLSMDLRFFQTTEETKFFPNSFN